MAKNTTIRNRGTVLISDNHSVLSWFEENASAILKINPKEIVDKETILAQHFGTIILDIDMKNSQDWSDAIYKYQPFSTKIVLSRQYSPEKAIEMLRFGVNHYMLFPTTQSKFQQILTNEATRSTQSKRAQLLMGILLSEIQVNNQSLSHIFADVVTEDNINSVMASKIEFTKKLLEEKNKLGEPVNGLELLAIFPLRLLENMKIKKTIKKQLPSDIFNTLVTAHPNILIIEDEQTFRNKLTDYLSRYSNNIQAFESGEKALEYANNTTDICVKLLDIELPGASGVELLPKLNKTFLHSETIMLTAYDNFEYVTTSFNNDAIDYLVKPITPSILVNKVSRAVQLRAIKHLVHSLSALICTAIPKENRLPLLNQLIGSQISSGNPVTMDDLYCLFPEYKKVGISKSKEIPKTILEDGVGLFLTCFDYNLKRGIDCNPILENWNLFLSNLHND